MNELLSLEDSTEATRSFKILCSSCNTKS